MIITQICRQNIFVKVSWQKLTIPILKRECQIRGLQMSTGHRDQMVSKFEKKEQPTNRQIGPTPDNVPGHTNDKISDLECLQDDLKRLQREALEMKGLMSVMVTSKDGAPKLNNIKQQLSGAQDQAMLLQDKIESMKKLYQETHNRAHKDNNNNTTTTDKNDNSWWYILGGLVGGAWFLRGAPIVKAHNDNAN